MYQAIVFLPLLGAILAALIALAGARARFPGKGPPPAAEDDAADHAPHHGAPSGAGARSFIIPIMSRPCTSRPPSARAPPN